jgi:hypothetical protein
LLTRVVEATVRGAVPVLTVDVYFSAVTPLVTFSVVPTVAVVPHSIEPVNVPVFAVVTPNVTLPYAVRVA